MVRRCSARARFFVHGSKAPGSGATQRFRCDAGVTTGDSGADRPRLRSHSAMRRFSRHRLTRWHIMWRFRGFDSRCTGGPLPLSLDTREVGRVTIVHCNGRIVAGSECDSLRAHITWLLRDRRSIVLHLGEVGFIDSSGLGTMVRALTTTRQAKGDLKLSNVPDFVRKVLEMSRLTAVFDSHESEEKAIAAFYRPGARAEAPAAIGRS